jgi:hypothetical protein
MWLPYIVLDGDLNTPTFAAFCLILLVIVMGTWAFFYWCDRS